MFVCLSACLSVESTSSCFRQHEEQRNTFKARAHTSTLNYRNIPSSPVYVRTSLFSGKRRQTREQHKATNIITNHYERECRRFHLAHLRRHRNTEKSALRETNRYTEIKRWVGRKYNWLRTGLGLVGMNYGLRNVCS